jgi:multiple sugar transport system permease protein
MSIFVLLGEWNNFVWPLIVIQSSDNRTLPLALALLNSALNGASNQGVLMAAAMLVSLPTVLLFLIFQKQFIRGIALTGVKG